MQPRQETTCWQPTRYCTIQQGLKGVAVLILCFMMHTQVQRQLIIACSASLASLHVPSLPAYSTKHHLNIISRLVWLAAADACE